MPGGKYWRDTIASDLIRKLETFHGRSLGVILRDVSIFSTFNAVKDYILGIKAKKDELTCLLRSHNKVVYPNKSVYLCVM